MRSQLSNMLNQAKYFKSKMDFYDGDLKEKCNQELGNFDINKFLNSKKFKGSPEALAKFEIFMKFHEL